MVRTKLEGKSVTELKVDSKLLPQALLLLDYLLTVLKEMEGGHPISWVFIELLVMRSTAKPESLPLSHEVAALVLGSLRACHY